MAYKRYEVPMVQQNTSSVCWLACAIMILQYKRGDCFNINEIRSDFNQDFRMPGNVQRSVYLAEDEHTQDFLSEIGFEFRHFRNILRGIRRPYPTMRVVPTPQAAQQAQNETDALLYMLQSYGPLILYHHAGSFSYGRGTVWNRENAGNGHGVVITGIDTNRGVIYFNNPWGQVDIITTISSIIGAANRWERVTNRPAFVFLR